MFSSFQGGDDDDSYIGDGAVQARRPRLTKRKRAASVGGEEMLNQYSAQFGVTSSQQPFAPQARQQYISPQPTSYSEPDGADFLPELQAVCEFQPPANDYLPLDELGFPLVSPGALPPDFGYAAPVEAPLPSSVPPSATPALSTEQTEFDQDLANFMSHPYFGVNAGPTPPAQTQLPSQPQTQAEILSPAPQFPPGSRQYRSKSFSAWESDRLQASLTSTASTSSQRHRLASMPDMLAGEPALTRGTSGLPPLGPLEDENGMMTHISSVLGTPFTMPAHPLQYTASSLPRYATASVYPSAPPLEATGPHHQSFLSFSSFPPPQTDIQPSSSSDEEGNSSDSRSQDSAEVKKPQRKKAKGPNGEPLPRVKRVPYKILKTLPSEQYDELVMLEVKELRSRLAANGQPTKGLQMDLMARIADCYLHGCLPVCPQCRRCLVVPVLDGGYVCQSSTDPATAGQCTFASNDIQRIPWHIKEGCVI